jgi:hypothetical protein
MPQKGKAPILMDTRKADSYEVLPLRIPGSVRLAPEELASGASGLELDINRPVVASSASPDLTFPCWAGSERGCPPRCDRGHNGSRTLYATLRL